MKNIMKSLTVLSLVVTAFMFSPAQSFTTQTAQAQEKKQEQLKRFNRLLVERDKFYRERESLKQQAARLEAQGQQAIVEKAKIANAQENIDWNEEQLETLAVQLGREVPPPAINQSPEAEKAKLQDTINTVTSVGNEAVDEVHRNNCLKILRSINFSKFLQRR